MKAPCAVLGFASVFCSVTTSAAPDDVIVIATKLDKSAAEMTQSATVITEKEIREKNYTDTTEILRDTAGMEFKQAGGPGQFNYPKLRGFGGNSILVVIDGIKVNGAGSGDVNHLLGQIDPDSIERMEILRGPQATLYGANSTAGVIAITTKSGNTPGAGIGVEAGSYDWKKGSASIRDNQEIGAGKLAYSINYSRTDSDGVNPQEYYKDESQQLKLSYAQDAFEVGGSYWRMANKFQYAQLIEPYDRLKSHAQYYSFQIPDPHQYRATQQSVATLWATHNITDRLSQTLQIGRMHENDANLDLYDGLLGSITAPFDGFDPFGTGPNARGTVIPVYDTDGGSQAAKIENTNKQVNYTLKYRGDIASGLVGFERVGQDFKQRGAWGDVNPPSDSAKSFYANGDLRLLDQHLILALGVRHDDYNSWGDKTTGNAGIAFQFDNLGTLYANYGTSFRTPTLLELYSVYGSPTVKPENGHTAELGFRQSLLDNRLNWDATLWRTDLDDVIFTDYSIPNPAAFYGFGRANNGDKERTQGIELNFSYLFATHWNLAGNYTYTDARMRQKGSSDWERTIQIAHNKANLDLSYRFGDAAVVGAHLYYTGPRLRWAGDLETSGYVRTDLYARWSVISSLTLYARIENLFDRRIVEELGYKQPGLYAIGGVQYRFF